MTDIEQLPGSLNVFSLKVIVVFQYLKLLADHTVKGPLILWFYIDCTNGPITESPQHYTYVSVGYIPFQSM